MNFYRNSKLYLLALFLLYGNLIISEDNREINTDEYNNLWSIGIELKEIYNEFSVYQIMLSLLELNESAFENENINYLKKGYFLNLPEEKDLEKLEALSSVREVASQNLAANVGPIDFSVLVDVLVLSEPTFLLSEEDEDTSLILEEIDIVSTEQPLNNNKKSLITYSVTDDPNLDPSEKIIVVNLSGRRDEDMANEVKVEDSSLTSDEINTVDAEEFLIDFVEPDMASNENKDLTGLEGNIDDVSLILDETDLVDADEFLIDFVEPEMALNENKDAIDFEESDVQIETIDIPEFEIGSNELSTIEKNFEKIPNRDFLNTEFYLLIGFILLLAFLLMLRNRPAKNETKTLKNDEELKNDLDEEFGEIGDPIEARINLAITYIEMNQTDKANDLLSQVLESEATESQKEKARKLIKEI
jgi:FimV-like protein